MITLEAEIRDVKVNPKHVRKAGKVPAVYYGSGKESTAIAIARLPLEKAILEAGESTIISLKTPTGAFDALIHDVDHNPVTGEPIHVDFYIVAKDRKIEVDVPLEYTGTAGAEKEGGVVMKIMHELRIEALPGALPSHITVDLSSLAKINDQITVSDLKLPAGVEAMVAENEVVALAAAPKEEEEAPVAAVDMSAIEVEKKGKKEEEEEAPAE
jgi:large subunit ribosomal protein L25